MNPPAISPSSPPQRYAVSPADAPARPRFDWTRNPPPANLTPFQEFTRNVDWANSPLGPMEEWPAQLRQMVLLIMADPLPAVVYWGDETTIVYNEAYVPLIGQKHPDLQGQDPKIGFAEVWDTFAKIIRDGQETGLTHVGDRQMLLFHRFGFLEETYYTWKFVPMIGNEGYVVASYATVVEVSKEMIGNRRLASLHELEAQMAATKSMDTFWPNLFKGLEPNDKDIPLLMMYSVTKRAGDSGSPDSVDSCILEQWMGVSDEDIASLSKIDLHNDQSGIGSIYKGCIESVKYSPTLVERKELPPNLFSSTNWRGFGVPSEQFLLYPIRTRNGTLVRFMLVGLNPRRKYDSDYQDYVHLLTKHITSHLSELILAEEVKQSEHNARASALQRAELSNQLRQRTKEFEESEDRFAQFASLANVGVATSDLDGRVIYANSAWTAFTGHIPGVSDYLTMLDSVVPEDEDIIREEWARVLALKPANTFQIRTKLPFSMHNVEHGLMEADYKTGLCTAYPQLDDDGKLVGATALSMDISELKWIENEVRLRSRELEQSEVKYRTFADHAPIGVALISSIGMIEYTNPAWLNILDQEADWETPRPWLQAVHPDDYVKMEQFFDDIVSGKGPLTVEARLKRPWDMPGQKPGLNHDTAWILASGYGELNRAGELKNVVCWITEISMQKAVAKGLNTKMKEALELKRQQENFIDMISHEIRNPLSAVLHCAEEIDRSMAESLTAIASPNFQQTFQPSLNSLLESAIDASQTIVHCVQHQKRVVDDVLTLSKLDSDLLTISPVPLQPANTAKEAFKLFEGELKTAQIETSVILDESLQQLNVDWILLDPSRLLQVLINLITNAIKFTRDRKTRHITLKIAASTTRPTVNSTVDYFPQHINRKQPARTQHLETNKNTIYLSVSVTDTGKGLSPDEKVRLFQRFAQGSPKTHVQYGGSGLGLFISRQITEMMGGEIGVASEEGRGSTFTFFVQTQVVEAPKANPFEAKDLTRRLSSLIINNGADATTGGADASQIAKILVVEDNLVNQKVLAKQLIKRGYCVVTANHGGEALERLYQTTSYVDGGTEDSFHVILMDIEMPHMDGLSCVRHIRKLEAAGSLKGHHAVVAVTANVRIEHVRAAMEAGMDGVTTKPYRMEELVTEMKTAYRKSHVAQHR
ncbi:hypothetical protein BT63DRAFT_444408 [Microthyrium microscopicum]|uniref:histidine kinase n=1 Tax=Microthyrium microscopicum TaxID=703497 RepID=A0A6A6TV75_9PEZI|nr:hypothetical protein BT63DRAFT_444408 [Microthyrium microscopicum]